MRIMFRYGLLPIYVLSVLCVLFVLGVPQPSANAEESKDDVSDEDAKFFRDEVFPLLKDSCHRCHGEKKQQSGLRLDSRDAVLKGGQNGPAIVVGKPDESLMMKVLGYEGDIQMPPDAKLDDEKIAIFKKWIEKEAPWPKEKKK